MRHVHPPLRILALLLGLEQLVAHLGQRFVATGLTCTERLDFRTQLLDLVFARNRTLLRLATAHHAQPAGPQPLAAACDDRLVRTQSRQHRARLRCILGDQDAVKQAVDRRWPNDLGGERSLTGRLLVGRRRKQCNASLRQSAQGMRVVGRRVDRYGFQQAAKDGLHGGFPASFHLQQFTQARVALDALRLQPVQRDILFLAQRCVLQRFQ